MIVQGRCRVPVRPPAKVRHWVDYPQPHTGYSNPAIPVAAQGAPGTGTTVRTFLRKSEATVTATAETGDAAVEKANPSGNGTLLVVENDGNVRDFLVVALGRLGYTVSNAEDGAEALQLIKTPATIDLLLTDIVLPQGMNGSDVAGAFRQHHKMAGVLYSSGYSHEVLDKRGDINHDGVLLRKP